MNRPVVKAKRTATFGMRNGTCFLQQMWKRSGCWTPKRARDTATRRDAVTPAKAYELCSRPRASILD